MEPTVLSVWFAKMKNSVKHISVPEKSEWFTNHYILSTGFEGLQCNATSFPYVHSVINSGWFEQLKDKYAHGATQEAVNGTDVEQIKLVIPTLALLQQYAEKTNPILQKKFNLMLEIKLLKEQREYLLPLLLNGQVKLE